MNANRCPKCGAIAGVVFGPSGDVQSCTGCEKLASETKMAEERNARKDEIDKYSLSAASRSTVKDILDLGSKLAGVTIAAGALFKANEKPETKTAALTDDDRPIPRVVEPYPILEAEAALVSQFAQARLVFGAEATADIELMSRKMRLSFAELMGMALGLLKCVVDEQEKGLKVVLATGGGRSLYELRLPF